jgi:hypothetical protein
MVDLEQLTVRGRRAYELGRLRVAARAALLVLPLVLLCAFESGRGGACACLGGALLALSIGLRWASRRGGESVAVGLAAGSVPLLVGLAARRLAPWCTSAGLVPACTVACAVAGGAAGVWLGVRLARGRAGLGAWAVTGLVALLAASLGCVGLGLAAAGAGAGLLVGGAGGALFARGTGAVR